MKQRLHDIKNIGVIEFPQKENDDYFAGSPFVCEITPKDFDTKVTYQPTKGKSKNIRGCTMILFYAPWCPYCKAVKDDWTEFAKVATFINVCALNCEKHKDHVHKMNIDFQAEHGDRLVPSYPTIALYKGGKFIKKYDDERSVQKLLEFAVKNSCRK